VKQALVFAFEQRVHAITINSIEEKIMTYPLKAHVGDTLFIDGTTQRVLFVHDRDTQPEYELEDGRCLATAISATTMCCSNRRTGDR